MRTQKHKHTAQRNTNPGHDLVSVQHISVQCDAVWTDMGEAEVGQVGWTAVAAPGGEVGLYGKLVGKRLSGWLSLVGRGER